MMKFVILKLENFVRCSYIYCEEIFVSFIVVWYFLDKIIISLMRFVFILVLFLGMLFFSVKNYGVFWMLIGVDIL